MEEKEIKGKEIFADILDENEKVIAVVRPNGKKYWALFNWSMFFSLIWILFFSVILVIPLHTDDESGVFNSPHWSVYLIAGGIGLGICAVMYLLSFVFAKLTYNKRYYAYTDSRILIRCGIIGVDYKTLDYKLLGATSVTVGLLDRIMGGKTGYIRFGSASSPISSIAGAYGYMGSGYTFAHVDKPYELLREIKKTMNGAQEQEKK